MPPALLDVLHLAPGTKVGLTVDLGSRHRRKLETVPATIMDEVLARITTLFE